MQNEVCQPSLCKPLTLHHPRLSGRPLPKTRSHFGHHLLECLSISLLITAAAMGVGVEPASAQDDTAETGESVNEFEVYRDEEIRESAPPDSGESSAQDETAEDGAEGRSPKLTEEERKNLEVLFVTGKQGSRDLQDLPEAISSFSSADLLAQGITDFNTLQFSVPSLFSGGGLTKIRLRGVGSEVVGKQDGRSGKIFVQRTRFLSGKFLVGNGRHALRPVAPHHKIADTTGRLVGIVE